jgi:hypothetical protein
MANLVHHFFGDLIINYAALPLNEWSISSTDTIYNIINKSYNYNCFYIFFKQQVLLTTNGCKAHKHNHGQAEKAKKQYNHGVVYKQNTATPKREKKPPPPTAQKQQLLIVFTLFSLRIVVHRKFNCFYIVFITKYCIPITNGGQVCSQYNGGNARRTQRQP